jgi:N-acetylneuraminate synthase
MVERLKTIVTADACVNHNGCFNNLLGLLDMVYKTQVVTGEKILFKVQKRNPEVYSSKMYNSWVLEKQVPYREHKRALEFDIWQFELLDKEARKRGIEWYCSVFDRKSLDDMASNFSFNYWKIASPVTACDVGLVAEICKQPGLKIMSTGMCTIEELDKAIYVALKNTTDDDLILMHCISMYPTPNRRVNLAVMDTLGERYGLRVGYSSHDAGVPISVAAVARGAVAIEKHITLDHTYPGPDHALSLEYRGLETLIKHIQAVENAIGKPEKMYYDEEKEIREKVQIAA